MGCCFSPSHARVGCCLHDSVERGGESLLPSVAGGINFGPEWEVTVDFNCSPDFKELLGISSPLAPPAKRQRLDDASSSDARKKCAECGEEGGPEAKFCSQCGHRFDNSTDVEVISFTLDGEEADDGQRVLGSLRGLVPQFFFSVRGFRVTVLGGGGGGGPGAFCSLRWKRTFMPT